MARRLLHFPPSPHGDAADRSQPRMYLRARPDDAPARHDLDVGEAVAPLPLATQVHADRIVREVTAAVGGMTWLPAFNPATPPLALEVRSAGLHVVGEARRAMQRFRRR